MAIDSLWSTDWVHLNNEKKKKKINSFRCRLSLYGETPLLISDMCNMWVMTLFCTNPKETLILFSLFLSFSLSLLNFVYPCRLTWFDSQRWLVSKSAFYRVLPTYFPTVFFVPNWNKSWVDIFVKEKELFKNKSSLRVQCDKHESTFFFAYPFFLFPLNHHLISVLVKHW